MNTFCKSLVVFANEAFEHDTSFSASNLLTQQTNLLIKHNYKVVWSRLVLTVKWAGNLVWLGVTRL